MDGCFNGDFEKYCKWIGLSTEIMKSIVTG
jgi:hypothetical protein